MICNRIRYWFTNFCFTCRYRIARIFNLEIPKLDVFQQKTSELNDFVVQFNVAVNTLDTAMNNLIHINDSIDEKISEVDTYRDRLAQTRTGLEDARRKNERVISNFRALLGSD